MTVVAELREPVFFRKKLAAARRRSRLANMVAKDDEDRRKHDVYLCTKCWREALLDDVYLLWRTITGEWPDHKVANQMRDALFRRDMKRIADA